MSVRGWINRRRVATERPGFTARKSREMLVKHAAYGATVVAPKAPSLPVQVMVEAEGNGHGDPTSGVWKQCPRLKQHLYAAHVRVLVGLTSALVLGGRSRCKASGEIRRGDRRE